MANIKNQLNAAFKELRSAGFLARQNFMCCSNCAGYALANKASDLVDAGKSPKGCVFYHHQDATALRPSPRTWRRSKPEPLMIRYGSIETTKHGEIGLPTAEIGKIICDVFKRLNIEYTWDGDPNSCIEVTV